MNTSPFGDRMARAGLTLLASVALAACGGGSGSADEGSATAATAAQPAPASTASADTSAATSTGPDASIESIRISKKSPNEVAPGTGVFVDANAGSDSNPGTFDLPWKTLAKLTGARLATGNGIYLRCGSVWRESLALSATQLVDGSIIAGYGPACATTKAKISGADSYSGGWTKSGQIWSRAVPKGMARITRLFVNGAPVRTAQWPNYGGIGHEFAISAPNSASSKNSLTVGSNDLATIKGQDIAGADIAIRSQSWYMEAQQVSALNTTSGVLTLAGPTNYTMAPGNGYVLQNKRWMLDAPGEFFHDVTNGVLYMYPPDTATQTNLNTALVEASSRNTALSLTGRSRLALSNISVVMGLTDGITFVDVPLIAATSIESSLNGRSGIKVTLHTAPTGTTRGGSIANSTFTGNVQYGIDGTYGPRVDISRSTFTDTGTVAVAGMSFAAINSGDGAYVDRNTIQRSALGGIRFSGTDGTQVTNNIIVGGCLRLADCGSIDTWNGAKLSVNQLSLVASNQVFGQAPNLEGTVEAGLFTAGIYLDDFTMGTTVQNNMVTGMPVGIMLHNARNVVVDSNKFWLTTQSSLWANSDQTDADYLKNNTVKNNQFAPLMTSTGTFPATPQVVASRAIQFWDTLNGAAGIAGNNNAFYGNEVLQLNGTSVATVQTRGPTGEQYLSWTDWRNMNPNEAPAEAPATYALYQPTLSAELLGSNTLTTTLTPWTTWFYSGGSGGSAVWGNMAACGSSCAVFTTGSGYDMLYSPTFSLNAGKPHVLTFTLSFGGNASVARPQMGTATSPSTGIVTGGLTSAVSLTGTAGSSVQYQSFFTPTSNATSRVGLSVTTPGVPVGFKSMSLKEVLGYTFPTTSAWAAIVSTTPDASKSVSCATLGWSDGCKVMDSNDGSNVVLPMTLSPGASKLLLRTDSALKQ